MSRRRARILVAEMWNVHSPLQASQTACHPSHSAFGKPADVPVHTPGETPDCGPTKGRARAVADSSVATLATSAVAVAAQQTTKRM